MIAKSLWLFSVIVIHVTSLEVEMNIKEFKSVYDIPADIPTCRQTDLHINECIKDAFEQVMPRLKDGIPELNIPPMDPFVLERTSYEYSSGVIQGRIVMKKIQVLGMSDSLVDYVNFEIKNDIMSMDIITRVPHIYVEGYYKADMKFNEIRMTPKGYFNVSMKDVAMDSRFEGELYKRDDGHTYLKLTSIKAEPDVGDMRIYASGLFPDPTLNGVILDFVNQYWRQIYKTMLPETRTTWEPFMINSANEFLSSVPFDLVMDITKK